MVVRTRDRDPSSRSGPGRSFSRGGLPFGYKANVAGVGEQFPGYIVQEDEFFILIEDDASNFLARD